MLGDLPPWARTDADAVREEAVPYGAMTPEERGAIGARLCRGGARMLASRADRERAMAWRDPLPLSTQRALERLRAESRQ